MNESHYFNHFASVMLQTNGKSHFVKPSTQTMRRMDCSLAVLIDNPFLPEITRKLTDYRHASDLHSRLCLNCASAQITDTLLTCKNNRHRFCSSQNTKAIAGQTILSYNCKLIGRMIFKSRVDLIKTCN